VGTGGEDDKAPVPGEAAQTLADVLPLLGDGVGGIEEVAGNDHPGDVVLAG